MKASDLLVKCLVNEGIGYIFAVPGEEDADFMLSLEKSTSIRLSLTRHEQLPDRQQTGQLVLNDLVPYRVATCGAARSHLQDVADRGGQCCAVVTRAACRRGWVPCRYVSPASGN